jgi:hypothetical protein
VSRLRDAAYGRDTAAHRIAVIASGETLAGAFRERDGSGR